jgi:hypothetical protein
MENDRETDVERDLGDDEPDDDSLTEDIDDVEAGADEEDKADVGGGR